MVDEKKVKLMTKIAIYEKKEKSKSLVLSKYFQSDYVRYNVLKTLVAATVVYWAIVAYYCFMNFDTILAKISSTDYFSVMYKLLIGYVIFGVIYFVIASIIFNVRYEKAKPGLIEYNSNLRDLIELEGGPMHYTKVVKKSNMTVETDVPKPVKRTNPSASVSKMDMIKKRQEEQDNERKQQIIQNAKARDERMATAEKEKQQKELQIAAERKRIQERRRQLEKEQLERIRREQQEKMTRENHTYNSYDGNINRTVNANRDVNRNVNGNVNRNVNTNYRNNSGANNADINTGNYTRNFTSDNNYEGRKN